jgi:hypothetical protein
MPVKNKIAGKYRKPILATELPVYFINAGSTRSHSKKTNSYPVF